MFIQGIKFDPVEPTKSHFIVPSSKKTDSKAH